MSEDISKNTVLVLVVLTIVISLLGTWTVMTEALKTTTQQESTQSDGSTTATGQVQLNIQSAPAPQSVTGRVIINIE